MFTETILADLFVRIRRLLLLIMWYGHRLNNSNSSCIHCKWCKWCHLRQSDPLLKLRLSRSIRFVDGERTYCICQNILTSNFFTSNTSIFLMFFRSECLHPRSNIVLPHIHSHAEHTLRYPPLPSHPGIIQWCSLKTCLFSDMCSQYQSSQAYLSVNVCI